MKAELALCIAPLKGHRVTLGAPSNARYVVDLLDDGWREAGCGSAEFDFRMLDGDDEPAFGGEPERFDFMSFAKFVGLEIAFGEPRCIPVGAFFCLVGGTTPGAPWDTV